MRQKVAALAAQVAEQIIGERVAVSVTVGAGLGPIVPLDMKRTAMSYRISDTTNRAAAIRITHIVAVAITRPGNESTATRIAGRSAGLALPGFLPRPRRGFSLAVGTLLFDALGARRLERRFSGSGASWILLASVMVTAVSPMALTGSTCRSSTGSRRKSQALCWKRIIAIMCVAWWR